MFTGTVCVSGRCWEQELTDAPDASASLLGEMFAARLLLVIVFVRVRQSDYGPSCGVNIGNKWPERGRAPVVDFFSLPAPAGGRVLALHY